MTRARMIVLLLGCLTTARPLGAQARAAADSAAVREVRVASEALDRALAAGDTAALARLYADGYVHVDQFGTRTGKAERLAELGAGTRRVQSAPPPADTRYAVFGDVVVATARTDGRQTLNGSAVRGGPRLGTRVWLRRDGRWQVILAQTTPIADGAGAPPADTTPVGRDRAGAPCLRQGRAHVVLRGALRREVHLGPPGYGETPERDARDTIVVLVPPSPVPVCRDESTDSAGGPPLEARRLQLRGVSRTLLHHLGETVTVFGRLGEATFGFEFTPFVIYVDSIPDAHERPLRAAAAPLAHPRRWTARPAGCTFGHPHPPPGVTCRAASTVAPPLPARRSPPGTMRRRPRLPLRRATRRSLASCERGSSPRSPTAASPASSPSPSSTRR